MSESHLRSLPPGQSSNSRSAMPKAENSQGSKIRPQRYDSRPSQALNSQARTSSGWKQKNQQALGSARWRDRNTPPNKAVPRTDDVGAQPAPPRRTDSRQTHNAGSKRKWSGNSQDASLRETISKDSDSKEVLNKMCWQDEPPFKYVSQVGQGTYGKVYKAMNRVTGKMLAMKRLRLENQAEGLPITAAREIKLLEELNHENVIGLSEIVLSRGDIYMAFDYVEHDLAGLLLNPDLSIQPPQAKSIIRQTLSALEFLHSRSVLHRDIKGSNILVTVDGTIKLADFGLARYINHEHPGVKYTNRVITLWYRPPELLLGSEHYGPEVDTWGIGCLLVELFRDGPLFYGKDEVSQVQAIYEVLGIPGDDQWPERSSLPWFWLIESIPLTGATPAFRLDKVFSGDNVTRACYELAKDLLVWDPRKRMSATEALKHEYFKEEPQEARLDLRMEKEWHDWEAKRRKRGGDLSSPSL